MKDLINRFRSRLAKRLAPFLDLTAWVLVLVSLVPLLLIDVAMVVTLIQWTAFGFALAGITVIITRVVFPQVDLSEWLREARDGPREGRTAAALIVLAVALVVCAIFLGLVLWAKA